MKQIALTVLCIIILLTSSGCEKESQIGHLKITVTYPEAVVIPDQPTYFIQVPGVGAEVRLYDKDAQCWGYRDAMIDVAWIDGKPTGSKYALRSDEKGEVLFKDIPAGEYYLVVFARQLVKYTEKYIEVNGGDTLKLTKNFTSSGSFFKDLEPWDYEVPEN
ncbi:MAG: hypothetical protein DRI83_12475 [Bacteroidetes bacterium]|nr:MAG: hypothetical protein DRI83_12475 [Bacteroidota bacterium]